VFCVRIDSRFLVFTIVLFLSLGLAGCLLVTRGGAGNARTPSNGSIYTGDECAPYQRDNARPFVFRSSDHGRPFFTGVRRPKMSALDSAIFLACIDSTDLDYVKWLQPIADDHLAFDDRNFDHLRAANMVVDCALRPGCTGERNGDVLGMMDVYARAIDEARVEAALAAANVSRPLVQAIVARVGSARRIVAERATRLDRRRHEIYVDIPNQVRAERAEFYSRWKEQYAALDPLLVAARSGQGDRAQVGNDLRAVRATYFERCKVEGCVYAPIVLEITQALVLLAVGENDVPRALAEAKLLADRRLELQLFSRAILASQLAATTLEAERWQKYESARHGGADETTLRAMFGEVAPIQIDAYGPAVTWGSRALPDMTATLPRNGIQNIVGNVRGVAVNGNRTVVTFEDNVVEYSDADCRETNKIEGIDSGGKLIYRKVCTNWRTRTERTKIAPIEVPADEARGLRAREVVYGFLDAQRRGVIASVVRDGKIVQVRGHRLHVPEPLRPSH
jgi:hypothetical protein